jgi:Tachylectin
LSQRRASGKENSMSTDATITLQDLQCLRQDRGSDGSDPYIWPALVAIDSTFRVNVLTPFNESRVIIQSGMKNGQTASIPGTVGVQSRRLDGDLTGNHLILVTALWEKRDTPDNVVSAGYTAFSDSLQTGITANLLGLGSSDPATQQAAIDAVKAAVSSGVTDAISNSLTWYQKGEIAAGLMHLDNLIDNSSTAFSSLTSQSFTISFGGSIGGRLLFYRDTTQNGTGDVDTPGVIGQGGWENFKFLFSGGNGIIYAVNPEGQLLFYRDNTQNGTGDVNTPSVIGLGGWADFKFLFSGGNGIIYAVNP